MNFPLSKSSLGGRLGYELNRLAEAINSLRPISTPDTFTSLTTGGVSRTERRRKASASTVTEFKRLRVTREGWAAVEGEDDDGRLVIALKPWAILKNSGIDDVSYTFAGHTLTAERETDTGTWPEEEGFFIKVRNIDIPGEPNEYWHEVVWPPYIGDADAVVSGCRERTAPPPDAYLVAAKGAFSMPNVAIDDVTLDYYDEGAPVGNEVVPEWTDANFDARRWTPYTFVGNLLALDADELHVPNL